MMIFARTTVVTLLFASVSGLADAAPQAPISIKFGFYFGNTYRDLTQSAKRNYLAGFLDGALVSPAFKAPKAELGWLERCITGMTDAQLVAVVDKWLDTNPVRWQESMNILAYVALKESCPP